MYSSLFSYTAQRVYQKKLSKQVAEDGAKCMTTLVGTERDEHTAEIANDLRGTSEDKTTSLLVDLNEPIEVTPEENASVKGVKTKGKEDVADSVREEVSGSQNSVDVGNNLEVIDVDANVPGCSKVPDKTVDSLPVKLTTTDDLRVKMEALEDDISQKRVTFSRVEDNFIKEGVKKHWESKSIWSDILSDKEYTFKTGRTRDSLRVRATSLKLNVPAKTSKKKGKGPLKVKSN